MIIADTKLIEFEEAMDNLRRVKMAARDHWLVALGLSEPQIHIMLSLYNDNCWTTGEMAKQLCVSASAATQTTETLVRRGLVTRAEDPADRRVSRLTLTAEGRELAQSIAEKRRQYFAGILAELTPSEISSMVKALHVLARVMTEQYQQPTERS